MTAASHDTEALIAEFIRTKKITRCPTVYAIGAKTPNGHPVPEVDRIALKFHDDQRTALLRNKKQQHLQELFGGPVEPRQESEPIPQPRISSETQTPTAFRSLDSAGPGHSISKRTETSENLPDKRDKGENTEYCGFVIAGQEKYSPISFLGQKPKFTATEFVVLSAIIRASAKGRVLPRESLRREIAGYINEEPSERAIDSHIKRIRRKLELLFDGENSPDAIASKLIETKFIQAVYDTGYRVSPALQEAIDAIGIEALTIAARRTQLHGEFLTRVSAQGQKVPWVGEVDRFILFFAVMANKDWRSVGSLLGVSKQTLRHLRDPNSNFTPTIRLENIKHFFKNLAPGDLIAAEMAMNNGERNKIFSHLSQLGFSNLKSSGMVPWTADNLRRFDEFLKCHDLLPSHVVPLQLYKKMPHFKLHKLPSQAVAFSLYQIAWRMENALRGKVVAVDSLRQRLEGEAWAYFERMARPYFRAGVIPLRLPWHGSVRAMANFAQARLKMPSVQMAAALGYSTNAGIYHLNANRESKIEIDRLIHLAHAFAERNSIALVEAELFGQSFDKPKSAAQVQARLARGAKKVIDVSHLSQSVLKELNGLLPPELRGNSGLPSFVAWGMAGRMRLKSSRVRSAPAHSHGPLQRQINRLSSKAGVMTVQSETLIRIAGYLAEIKGPSNSVLKAKPRSFEAPQRPGGTEHLPRKPISLRAPADVV